MRLTGVSHGTAAEPENSLLVGSRRATRPVALTTQVDVHAKIYSVHRPAYMLCIRRGVSSTADFVSRKGTQAFTVCGRVFEEHMNEFRQNVGL